jgi:hypothetical protein
MKIRIVVVACALAAVLAAEAVQAAQPRRQWVKVEISWADGRPLPVPLDAVLAAGGEDVADYSGFRLVSLPAEALAELQARAAAHGIRVRSRDELDRIETPGAAIDARRGLDPNLSPKGLTRGYPAKTKGLYLVQLIGPAKAEWYRELRRLGWTIVRYLPSDAYVLAGPPDLAGRTTGLPFVQFFDFYHPFEKAAHLPRGGAPADLLFEVPNIDGVQATIDAITAAAVPGTLRVDRFDKDIYVHARMTRGEATALLVEGLVIGVGLEPLSRPSEERQSSALTDHHNAAGSQPTSPTMYSSWITSHCSACSAANMPASLWTVGIADTGLDAGPFGTPHPDLAGREYWGAIFASPNDVCGDCDDLSHGTLVAGIIAANASTGIADSGGYYDGAGVAQSAGVFSTKIFSSVGGATGNIFNWASDAASHGVTIQNHSHNDYNTRPATSGQYTTESRQYDQATRDADNNAANGRTPMLFTVSSGNSDQGDPGDPNRVLVLPPATAKNVIAMGGSESYRPDQDSLNCHGSLADDFRNIMAESRHGTLMSGYIKPDLVAPASMIVSTHTQTDRLRFRSYCNDNFDGNHLYMMESGTSFAAPAAAGAAILAKRYIGSTPAQTSPALTKAVLIAGAHSIRDGLDRTTSPATLRVGAAPNTQQGFGRLSLEDVMTDSLLGWEQSSARHFTSSGQTWTTRLTVTDASKPVLIALVWTDAPAAAMVSNPLVNDLNLTIRPLSASCTYLQGNKLEVTDPNRGEESVSYGCTQSAPVDSVNNVEYARFWVSGFTQFDVKVGAGAVNDVGDPAYRSSANQDFALVVLNASLGDPTTPVAPQLTATADAAVPSTVTVSWSEPRNLLVDHYVVNRGSTLANVAPVPPNLTARTYIDSRPAGVSTWIYSVTAVSPDDQKVTSNRDIATTIAYADDTLIPGTEIRAQHVTQLRQAIDAVRAAAQMSPTSWTDPTLTGVEVKAVHMTEMRSQLAAALSALGIPAIAYTYTPAAGVEIHATDVNELRANTK